MTKKRKKKLEVPVVIAMGGVNGPLTDAGAAVLRTSPYDLKAAEALESGAARGLLLTGGGDVNPTLYANKAHRTVSGVNDTRDTAELLALEVAVRQGVPVLGICRGAQLLNVALGGTLHQHVPDLPSAGHYHGGGSHHVTAARGSRLARAWGRQPERWTTSIHHQAVDQLGGGLVATAWSRDGMVEAVESVEGWQLGVQFHPELDARQVHMQRVFDHFVQAVAKHSGLVNFQIPARRASQVHTPTTTGARMSKRTGTVWNREDLRDVLRLDDSHADVLTLWRCFRCLVDFDERVDHSDHMFYLHGIDVETGCEVVS